MAQAIRVGYPTLFERNEYAQDLDHKALKGLVMEVTGLSKDQGTLNSIVRSFEAFKAFAKFDGAIPPDLPKEKPSDAHNDSLPANLKDAEVGLNLSYTIYLNLPKTDDIAVFNAIFKSLRDNFFRR
jgi:hypothetical protein